MTALLVDGLTDVVRMVNISLCLAWFVLAHLNRRRIEALHRSALLTVMAVGALVVAALWGSVETLVSPVTAPGIRSYIVTVGLVWAVAAQAYLHHDKRPPTT